MHVTKRGSTPSRQSRLIYSRTKEESKLNIRESCATHDIRYKLETNQEDRFKFSLVVSRP